VQLLQKIQQIYPKIMKQKNEYRLFSILCDKVEKISENDVFLAISTRSMKYMDFICEDIYSYIHSFLLSDYLEPLEFVDSDESVYSFIRRCNYLQEEVPEYWKNIQRRYREFAEKKYKKITNYTFIRDLESLFEGFFPEKILNRSQFIINISSLPRMVKCYVLGFPIHLYIPSDEAIEQALDLLSNLGIEKYCKEMNKTFKISTLDNVKIINKQNVCLEDIEEYSSFDIVSYYTDSLNCSEDELQINMFNFSRDEFKTLLKEKKNFYTNEILPNNLMEEIRKRIKIVSTHFIPNCFPLPEILKKIKDGEKITRDKLEERNVEGSIIDSEGQERLYSVSVPYYIDSEEVHDSIALSGRAIEYLENFNCECHEDDEITDCEELSDDSQEFEEFEEYL